MLILRLLGVTGLHWKCVFRPRSFSTAFRVGTAALALAAACVAVPAGSHASEPPLPAPEELPNSVVVFVDHVPLGLGRVTKAEFQRALLQAAAQAGRSAAPGPQAKGYPRLADRALEERVDSIWIQGQAREMGIGTRPREVSRELARLKQQTFKNNKQYRRFLREAHYTRRDVRERVMLQMLSEKIEVRVVDGLQPGEQAQAFRKFVREYGARWRARTVCADGYVTARCSNAP